MSMSLNRAMLIGHVTATPELRYTPQGSPVCTFTVATNRVWTDQKTGQRQESAEFTRCVAWNKLAEISSQVLTKGRQVYVDGRLQTREWDRRDGGRERSVEMVLENMIALGPAGPTGSAGRKLATSVKTPPAGEELASDDQVEVKTTDKKTKSRRGQEVPPEDIPF